MDTFFDSYFQFCLEPALETWAKDFLTQSLRVHDPNPTHSLARFQWSGLSDQPALQLTESCLQIQKWCRYKGRRVVSGPVCADRVRNGPASANQGSFIVSQGSFHAHCTLDTNLSNLVLSYGLIKHTHVPVADPEGVPWVPWVPWNPSFEGLPSKILCTNVLLRSHWSYALQLRSI